MTLRRLQVLDERGGAPVPTPGDGVAVAPRVPTLKVAIASRDLKALDSHFGSARRFAVYEVTPTTSRLLEALAFEAASDESGSHDTEGDDRIGPKVAALKGCNLLFVLAIGGPAAARVVGARIHPVKLKAPESIESIISRVQGLMTGTPPPWLRKAMLGAAAPGLDELDAEEPR
jgi:nitrogen fixation protein NifX